MNKSHVEQRDGGYSLTGTRISLDSVVYAFLRGESADGIVESFPSLTLEQVFGALAFYLANREIIDQSLRDGAIEFQRLRAESRQKNPALYAKLQAAR